MNNPTQDAIAKRDATQPTIAQVIAKMRPEIERAIPKGMDADRMARLALTVVRQTPDLARSTPESFAGALLTAAALGLEPGVNGEAYLVPYAIKKGPLAGKVECQLIIGYQGFAKLFWQHPMARHLDAQAVYERDEFDYAYGLDPYLRHKPAPVGDRGTVVAYYAVASLSTGAKSFVVLTPDEVKALRNGKVGPSGNIADPQRWMERKGLAIDTPIPTPFGWTTMGDLHEGDTVFDMDGQPVRVLETSDVKNIGCYRVTFANGQSIVCDEEHYWVARIGWKRGRAGWDTLPIADLYAAKQAGKPVTMPVTRPIQTQVVDLPVDPWVLGFWLGDGSSHHARITTNPVDLNDALVGIQTSGYIVGAVRPDPRSNAIDVGIRSMVKKQLADLGVLGAKHVPAEYMRGSEEQRLALLRGLMDSDGWIDAHRGRVWFGSTEETLTDAAAELARSLGEQVNRNVQTKRGYGKTVQFYVAGWKPAILPFTFRSKSDRFRTRKISTYRVVESIELIPSVPTRCIGVDSPTHTYLAGWDMVPTHNTALRQLVKLLPRSTQMNHALVADERTGTDLAAARVPEAITDGASPAGVDPDTGEVLDGELVDAPDNPGFGEQP